MCSQLLAELDGLLPRQQVAVVAATNRPDLIDAALLRPGRLDHLIHVPVPDHGARVAILRVLSRTVAVAPAVDVDQVAAATESFTGADLTALCQAAARLALAEDSEASHVLPHHFTQALQTCSASPPVSAQVAATYAAMQRSWGSG